MPFGRNRDREFDDDFDPRQRPGGPDGTITPVPTPIPTNLPVDESGDGRVSSGGGGGGGLGSLGPSLGARPVFKFGPVPQFNAPQFNAPTMEQALNEPGYQFRLGAGSDALERSAAARGVLRTGGTLKDLVEYGQNFGAQEYGNVFNRALQGYDRKYRGAYDAFAPRLAEYQLKGQAETAAGLAGFDREWQRYVFDNTPRGGGGPSRTLEDDLADLGGPPDDWSSGGRF
jgi:hypothetical protein